MLLFGQGCAIMTEWVARCHAKVKERAGPGGEERLLIVRVPASIEGCLSRGDTPRAPLSLRLHFMPALLLRAFGCGLSAGTFPKQMISSHLLLNQEDGVNT